MPRPPLPRGPPTSAIPTNLAPTTPTTPAGSQPVNTNLAPGSLYTDGGGNTQLYYNTAAPTLPVPSYAYDDPSSAGGSSSSSSGGISKGTLIGVIAGGAALVLLLLASIFYLLHRRRKRRQQHRPGRGFGHQKGHSLGSRSSFGFTIRPGAIPPSLRAPLYLQDPVPPTSSSLQAAYGMSMTPTTVGDSMFDRLFSAGTGTSPSVRTGARTDESHGDGTAPSSGTSGRYFTGREELEPPPLPTDSAAFPFPFAREKMSKDERPLTGSTSTAGAESTRPLFASLHKRAEQLAAGATASKYALSPEKSYAPSISDSTSFYTVGSSVTGWSAVLPENASGVSLAPLGPVLPSFPAPPRIEHAPEAERREYERRLEERLRQKVEERRSRMSAGGGAAAAGGMYALVSGSSSPPSPPSAPAAGPSNPLSTRLSNPALVQPHPPYPPQQQQPQQQQREWIADLDVGLTPTPTSEQERNPFASPSTAADELSLRDMSLRDLDRELSGSESYAVDPYHQVYGGSHPDLDIDLDRDLDRSIRGLEIRDDAESERYRVIERDRAMERLFDALEEGAKERVRGLIPGTGGSARTSQSQSLSVGTGTGTAPGKTVGRSRLSVGTLLSGSLGKRMSGATVLSGAASSGGGASGSGSSATARPGSYLYQQSPLGSSGVQPEPQAQPQAQPQPQPQPQAQASGSASGSTTARPGVLRKPKERRSALSVAKSFGSSAGSAGGGMR